MLDMPTTSRDVKDGNAQHITREPEQVKAFHGYSVGYVGYSVIASEAKQSRRSLGIAGLLRFARND